MLTNSYVVMQPCDDIMPLDYVTTWEWVNIRVSTFRPIPCVYVYYVSLVKAFSLSDIYTNCCLLHFNFHCCMYIPRAILYAAARETVFGNPCKNSCKVSTGCMTVHNLCMMSPILLHTLKVRTPYAEQQTLGEIPAC